jgi:hypothetical protein
MAANAEEKKVEASEAYMAIAKATILSIDSDYNNGLEDFIVPSAKPKNANLVQWHVLKSRIVDNAVSARICVKYLVMNNTFSFVNVTAEGADAENPKVIAVRDAMSALHMEYVSGQKPAPDTMTVKRFMTLVGFEMMMLAKAKGRGWRGTGIIEAHPFENWARTPFLASYIKSSADHIFHIYMAIMVAETVVRAKNQKKQDIDGEAEKAGRACYNAFNGVETSEEHREIITKMLIADRPTLASPDTLTGPQKSFCKMGKKLITKFAIIPTAQESATMTDIINGLLSGPSRRGVKAGAKRSTTKGTESSTSSSSASASRSRARERQESPVREREATTSPVRG